MKNVLGIFAKEPRPGAVKTRLASETSQGFAARTAEAFLLDTLHRMVSIEADRLLVYSPAEAHAAFTMLAGSSFRLLDQGDGNLGQRLQRFFRNQFAAGAEHIVVIGTDSPTLPPSFVSLAFQHLQTADIVLGPATDGGYYLLGCGRLLPIFQDIDWGAPTVLRDTLARLDAGCRLVLLPPWYDVDTLADWIVLHGHVMGMRKSGADPGAPRTEELLKTIAPSGLLARDQSLFCGRPPFSLEE